MIIKMEKSATRDQIGVVIAQLIANGRNYHVSDDRTMISVAGESGTPAECSAFSALGGVERVHSLKVNLLSPAPLFATPAKSPQPVWPV